MATKPHDLPRPTNLGLVHRYNYASQEIEDERPCTCPPADDPPMPCPRKYALQECRRANEAMADYERLSPVEKLDLAPDWQRAIVLVGAALIFMFGFVAVVMGLSWLVSAIL